MMKFWANFAKTGIPGKSSSNKEWKSFINNNEKSIMILDKRSDMRMSKFNTDINSLITELELSSVINSREQCALLFQITTFVGEDIFDDYQNRLDNKCTRVLARGFLDENSGVIDF